MAKPLHLCIHLSQNYLPDFSQILRFQPFTYVMLTWTPIVILALGLKDGRSLGASIVFTVHGLLKGRKGPEYDLTIGQHKKCKIEKYLENEGCSLIHSITVF